MDKMSNTLVKQSKNEFDIYLLMRICGEDSFVYIEIKMLKKDFQVRQGLNDSF